MKRKLTCIVCPKGCELSVELSGKEIIKVEGHTCKRGLAYAESECISPVRTVTTTVRIEGGGVLPVKTDKAIPKELMFDLMKEVNTITVPRSVRIGDVIVKNILNTGADLIATANIN